MLVFTLLPPTVRPLAMASAMAATCMLLRPPPCAASASPLPMNPFLRRRPCSLTTACIRRDSWTVAPVFAIAPATEDKSMFLITLDLSGAPDLVDWYTTPGQHLLTRVPLTEGLDPAPMFISSAPGTKFDLLVKSLPGTTSEQLCKLHVDDDVEIRPVKVPGFAIHNIKAPEAAETVLLFAVAEGISPIRALIESRFASGRADVRLYYVAKDMKSMPYQDRFEQWKNTGVKVEQLTLETQRIQEHFLQNGIIENPRSMGAVIVGPLILKKVINKVLLDHGVPQEKILTIGFNPDIKQSNLDLWASMV